LLVVSGQVRRSRQTLQNACANDFVILLKKSGAGCRHQARDVVAAAKLRGGQSAKRKCGASPTGGSYNIRKVIDGANIVAHDENRCERVGDDGAIETA